MNSQQSELRTLLTQIDDLLRIEEQLDDDDEVDRSCLLRIFECSLF